MMDADGSNPHMLFEGAYGNDLDHVPWSPDGSLLAVPKEKEVGGLWLVPTDGSEPWVVSGTEGWQCWTPVWSPTDDGWPLFFYSDGPEQDRVMLWYVSEAGEEPQGLAYADWGPIWTRDGSRLAVGFVELSGEVPQSDVYFFQSEPDFISGTDASP